MMKQDMKITADLDASVQFQGGEPDLKDVKNKFICYKVGQ